MRFIVITFTLLVALARFSCGAPLTIVENGNARAAIVVAKNEDHARRAGAAVQSYIEKMSGARLPIVTEGEDAGQPISIYVGHTGAAAAREALNGNLGDGITSETLATSGTLKGLQRRLAGRK